MEADPEKQRPFLGTRGSPARARLPSPMLTGLVRNLFSSPRLFSFLLAISLSGPATSSTERCSMVSGRAHGAAGSPPNRYQGKGSHLKPARGRTRGEGLHKRHQPAAASATAPLRLRPPRRKCVTAAPRLVGREAEVAFRLAG